eukprot:CAMPEP_0184677708 /NCGR_PEP_ID=MMETSP0312-20130426/294_1 /TAXON_ID=31354 /ORGANISM="Compsopogon coeruleus, Strain SAG 36.94" /LENGTH=429 /DNA_ID=CAMNT_0027125727 /DNA_START=1169 /DNA_END=2461 /DNA_ORIENTATION=-
MTGSLDQRNRSSGLVGFGRSKSSSVGVSGRKSTGANGSGSLRERVWMPGRRSGRYSDAVLSDVSVSVEHANRCRRHAELSIATSCLPVASTSFVYAEVELCMDEDREMIGCTEMIAGYEDPNFITSFALRTDLVSDTTKTVLISFYEVQRIRWRKPKPRLVGTSQFTMREVLQTPEQCLDLPIKSFRPGETLNGLECVGLAIVGVEEFKARPGHLDMISLRFSMGDDCLDERNSSFFFTISRELVNSPGQWNRVYRSEPCNGRVRNSDGLIGTETFHISKGSLCANDMERIVLVELYRCASNVDQQFEPPILCGCLEATLRSLGNCIKSGTSLALECPPPGNMNFGKLGLEPGSVVSSDPGHRNVLLFHVHCVRWFRSPQERVEILATRQQFVDRDRWARDTSPRSVVSKKWVGSMLRWTTEQTLDPVQ